MGEIREYKCTYSNSVGISAEVTAGLDLEFPDAYMHSETMQVLARAIKEHDNADFCLLPFCRTVEAEAMGAVLNYGDANTGPRAKDPICETCDDVLALPAADVTKGFTVINESIKTKIKKYDANDRLFAPSCGGGAMLDLAVYPLTLVRDFMGEPDSVESFAHMSRGVDMSNTFILKKGDAYACVNSGFETPNNNNAVISGSQGLVLFNDWFFCTDTVTLHDHDGVELQRSVTPNEINGYEFEVREVHRCLENGLLESTLVPHESTLGVMRLMTESGII